jgi:1,4-alpha-glucan branching enzyme
MLDLAGDIEAVLSANHPDPFGFFGMHRDEEGLVLRTFQPGARTVEVIDRAGHSIAKLSNVQNSGVFVGRLAGERPAAYRLRVAWRDETHDLDDPYAFPPILGELDVHLLAEGNHLQAWHRLGAHVKRIAETWGVAFAVWAPNARAVSVVGDFNGWDGRRHAMRRRHECGVWEIFVPGVEAGARYKYEIKSTAGTLLPLKADPFAFHAERPPQTASVVAGPPEHRWGDREWLQARARTNGPIAPISVYEVHLGSWRRNPEEGNRYLTYPELAETLVPYVRDMGFTHVEFLPVSEFPFDGSWGYQPIGLFAPTSRFGTADEFRALVDAFHRAGIGVLLDWVPGHFPTDAHGLGFFDGTHLYEHADPRQGHHQDWDTLIYNYGRRENLDAVQFLRRLNDLVHERAPGAITIAEESTAWPMVSRPTTQGGLGFSYKWNMGWMHDTLEYMAHDPVHRRYHHNQLSFGLIYAFSENFILPLSHDEVVHGKGSLLRKMPGDERQKFANLRAYYVFMFGHPGKKLLFMGDEFGQWKEWNHDTSLDWHLVEQAPHQGLQRLVRDLNHLYRSSPALNEGDHHDKGFMWIAADDSANSVLSFLRRARNPDDFVVVACNFTPMPRHDYRIGVPQANGYRELINSDAQIYGGANMGNAGYVEVERMPAHGFPCSVRLTVPPLAGLVLQPAVGPS